MRDIKFEYLFDYEWNDEWIDKKVFTLEEIKDWWVEDYLSCSFVSFADIVAVRQSTWLKDKEWNEIYEGDIVEYRWSKNEHTVVFDEYTLQYRLRTDWPTHLIHTKSDLKIIWNIYEPNLLPKE
jgi:hypothetical protein